jgi:hypothetical protein
VVGDRQRVKAVALGLVDKLGDPAEAVEQAELGMDMKMREIVRRECQSNPLRSVSSRPYRSGPRASSGPSTIYVHEPRRRVWTSRTGGL